MSSGQQRDSFSSRSAHSALAAPILPQAAGTRPPVSSRISALNTRRPPVGPGIRKGLVIGHDNFADVTPEAFFKRIKADPVERQIIEMLYNHGLPMPEEAFDNALMDFCIEKTTNAYILGAHPKATDDSVHYTVIPSSPFGKITIRWWNGLDWGVLFDFVNIQERKIVEYPDLFVMLQIENNMSWTYILSMEDEQMKSISSDTRFEYPLNADGIIERRWNVPPGSRVALHQRGCTDPFAIVLAPQLDPFPSEDVPVYHPMKPDLEPRMSD